MFAFAKDLLKLSWHVLNGLKSSCSGDGFLHLSAETSRCSDCIVFFIYILDN